LFETEFKSGSVFVFEETANLRRVVLLAEQTEYLGEIAVDMAVTKLLLEPIPVLSVPVPGNLA
jgi:hypothetical protein